MCGLTSWNSGSGVGYRQHRKISERHLDMLQDVIIVEVYASGLDDDDSRHRDRLPISQTGVTVLIRTLKTRDKWRFAQYRFRH
jgi:hypothetical protein